LLTVGEAKDAEFGLFLAFLLYTGCRLSEALSIELANVNLNEALAYVRETKNGAPRLVHLPPVLVSALSGHPRGLEHDAMFRICST
jgi:integrase